ncbi:MAG: 30S ribosomal protein S11 [Candidatus Nealsonbacteria bacterium]|nr:30S ribosomal protein S11 [Candidatus Nealsonbacteria bacterium]
MGKKRIAEKTKEELQAEREQLDKVMKTDAKGKSKGIREGRVYISCSYNNTLLTLADGQGNVLGWASSGNIGFKGSKKATPFAASKVADVISQKAQKIGIEKISIFIKGIGGGRDSSIRSLAARGFDIISIKDVTPIPHNGCRPPKARRV